MKRKKIAIIGQGNVGSHLFNALKDKAIVETVNPRTLENLPSDADLILICVSDNAIEEVVSRLPESNAVIAHTSGSIGMNVLKEQGGKYGVMYPLQTFTKGVDLNYKEIPVFLEGSNLETLEILKETAALFTEDIRYADSEQRRQLHLASVFTCNFVNALAAIGEDLLKKSGIDFSAVRPLMKQTVNKLDLLTPQEAQTGPARRKDTKVLETHLSMLSSKPEYQLIYRLLTETIQKHYEI